MNNQKKHEFMPNHMWALEIHINNILATFPKDELLYVLKRCEVIPFETDTFMEPVLPNTPKAAGVK